MKTISQRALDWLRVQKTRQLIDEMNRQEQIREETRIINRHRQLHSAMEADHAARTHQA